MNAKKGIFIYLSANCIFIIPIILLTFFRPDFYPSIYIVLMTFYHIFKITYLHILFDAVVLIYCISELVKRKMSFIFLLMFILITAINICLNIYWIIEGKMWTIQ